MAADASLELQDAIVKRLKADATMTSLVGNRVYDRVPAGPNGITAEFPYVSWGPEQEVPEYADCIDAAEIFVTLNVWSRAVGYAEAKKISAAIRASLHDAELTLTDNGFVYLEYDGRRLLRAADGETSQAVVTFRAGIEQN